MTRPLSEIQDDHFSSHDLGLVAYLLCLKKYGLLDLDRSFGNKVLFVLKRDDDIDQAVREYWDFNAHVDAQTYFNMLKRLKNQIFSSD